MNQPLRMEIIIIQQVEAEEEDFAVVEAMVMEEAVEEEILSIGSPINKATQKMAFNVITAIGMGI